MKYLFVGDLHGRHEVVTKAWVKAEKEGYDKIIFCGDIFDSFDRTVKDQFTTFYAVKELVEEGKAECVWANHEFSYLVDKMACSGFNKATYIRRHEFEPTVRNVFKPYLYLEDTILVTHAGLSHEKFTKEDIKHLDGWSKDIGSPYFDIGMARGGRALCGGPLWCDFNREFEPIPDLIQVFGHTHGKGIRTNGTNYCVDCVDNTEEFLSIEL